MKTIAESANDFRDLRDDEAPVYALGLSFDSKTRQLKDLLAEQLR